jgi:hypothetical protein
LFATKDPYEIEQNDLGVQEVPGSNPGGPTNGTYPVIEVQQTEIIVLRALPLQGTTALASGKAALHVLHGVTDFGLSRAGEGSHG